MVPITIEVPQKECHMTKDSNSQNNYGVCYFFILYFRLGMTNEFFKLQKTQG
jgi:hypothetical protein